MLRFWKQIENYLTFQETYNLPSDIQTLTT